MSTEPTTTHTRGVGRVAIADLIVGPNVREDTPDVRSYIANILAPSIAERGLLQPIVVNLRDDGRFELIMGWCRLQAFILLGHTHIPYNTRESLDDRELMLMKLEENIKRHQLTFKDEILAIKALHDINTTRGVQTEDPWTITRTGHLLNVSHGYTSEALAAAKLIQAGDKEIANASSLTEVRKIRAARRTDQLAKHLQSQAQANITTPTTKAKPKVKLVAESSEPSVNTTPLPIDPEKPTHTVRLSDMLLNMDCHDWFAAREPESVDLIYTDIPYGIDMDNLDMESVQRVAHSHDVDENLAQFPQFVAGAARVLRDKTYLLFFYALEHHNLLQDMLREKGFTVQSWPNIWIKPNAKNNAAHCWATKTMEFVMVARKGAAVLQKSMPKNYHFASAAVEQTQYMHPFFKAWDFSRWLLDHYVVPGMTAVDCYAGEGSLVKVLLEKHCKVIGIEKDEAHYNLLVENTRKVIKSILKGDVEFV